MELKRSEFQTITDQDLIEETRCTNCNKKITKHGVKFSMKIQESKLDKVWVFFCSVEEGTLWFSEKVKNDIKMDNVLEEYFAGVKYLKN